MKRKITNLKELEEEQEKLKMTMTLTPQELARSVGTNRHMLKEFMLKKVAIPAGALGLGVFAANKAFSSNGHESHSNTSPSNLFAHLLPLGINLFQAYFIKEQSKQINAIENEVSEPELST